MSILDTIKNRTSAGLQTRPLSRPIGVLSKRSFEKTIPVSITNASPSASSKKKAGEKPMKLDYGIIKGHSTYVMGASKASVTSRVNYGT